jgi:hypothetical protein
MMEEFEHKLNVRVQVLLPTLLALRVQNFTDAADTCGAEKHNVLVQALTLPALLVHKSTDTDS